MEMEDHYGLADPRHLMSGRLHFPPISPPPPPDLYSGHRNHLAPPPSQPYEMLMMAPPGSSHDIMMHHHHHHPDHDQFPTSDYNAQGTVTAATPAGGFGGGLEAVDMGCLGGDGGTGRWPRQETLTLLEIRSRLDSKFKEANQKGPLWDEVSRIMNEEHGYQRSGKKCREKFENLYKYYKKTKEGKAGRQDGKHYRFFRQLEALYGGGGATCDSTAAFNNSHQFTAPQAVPQPQKQKLSDSLSLSNNSSELDTSSSHHHDDDDSAEAAEKGKKRASGGKRSWKAKIREFVDSQMRRLVEKQETWLETMQRSLEHKERERMLRDDAWRKQEASRMDRQQRFWASERAWIKARDAALVEALHTLTSQSLTKNPTTTDNDGWSDCEIARLVQLRTGMDERFAAHIGCSQEVLWEEIAAEMGYQRSASVCKQKWTDITNDNNNNDNINNNALFLKECCNVMSNKKRKEHSARSYCYFPTAADSGYDHVVGAGAAAETVPYFEMDERGPKMAAQTSELLNGSSSSSPCDPSPNGAAQVQEGCFRMLMANGGSNLWEDYGLKLN